MHFDPIAPALWPPRLLIGHRRGHGLDRLIGGHGLDRIHDQPSPASTTRSSIQRLTSASLYRTLAARPTPSLTNRGPVPLHRLCSSQFGDTASSSAVCSVVSRRS